MQKMKAPAKASCGFFSRAQLFCRPGNGSFYSRGRKLIRTAILSNKVWIILGLSRFSDKGICAPNSAGPYVQKKCLVYLYLLKVIILFQWDCRVPKLKKRRWQNFDHTHFPKRDLTIFMVSQIVFRNILIFLL